MSRLAWEMTFCYLVVGMTVGISEQTGRAPELQHDMSSREQNMTRGIQVDVLPSAFASAAPLPTNLHPQCHQHKTKSS